MNYEIDIIEDNHIYGNLLRGHLERYFNLKVCLFTTASKFLSALDSKPKIICLDYYLPDMDGLELLKKIKKKSENSYVIIISSQSDLEMVAQLINNGAHDYMVKGIDTRQKLNSIINNILQLEQLKKENNTLRNIINNRYNFRSSINGRSPQIKNVLELMSKAAASNFPVLITGETGTGKELVAQGIHNNSEQKRSPFIPVNITSIPSTLIESELFGHEKGSFTGAEHQKKGKFEMANEGTLFLDEIGDLDIGLQSKILRAIQEKEILRVGGNKTIKLNFRLITATHRNLELMVSQGSFREDLYFRIRGLPILIPPLRERENDYLLLSKHFIQQYCLENSIEPKSLSKASLNKLHAYSFPGNIRELKAIVELACILSTNQIIAPEDIKLNDGIIVNKQLDIEKTLKEHINDIVLHHMERYGDNIKMVSNKLKISRPTLYRMLKEINYKQVKQE